MNALKLTLCAALAAGLSACVLPPDNGRDDGYRRDDRPRRDERRDSVPATPGNGSFRCDNGMNARVEYLGQDRIRIEKGSLKTLKRVFRLPLFSVPLCRISGGKTGRKCRRGCRRGR